MQDKEQQIFVVDLEDKVRELELEITSLKVNQEGLRGASQKDRQKIIQLMNQFSALEQWTLRILWGCIGLIALLAIMVIYYG